MREVIVKTWCDYEREYNGRKVEALIERNVVINDTLYHLDLTEANDSKLMEALRPFLEAAHAHEAVKLITKSKPKAKVSKASDETPPTPITKSVGRKYKPRRTSAEMEVIRKWGVDNHYAVHDDKPVPSHVIKAYDREHPDERLRAVNA